MEQENNYFKEKRLLKKSRLVDIMGGCCQYCGYKDSFYALEFHHINPSIKKYTITDYLLKPLNEQLEELKKCVLLCSNCHRAYHGGDIVKSFISSYNEEKALFYIQKEKEERFLANSILQELKKCPTCGKTIFSSRNKYCSRECYNIGRSIIKPKEFTNDKLFLPNKEELKKLIRSIPFTTIGKTYGVDSNAIRKWCDKYNLPRTKKEINSYSDEEWNLV